MKNVKRITAGLLSLSMIFSVASCSVGNKDKDSNSKEDVKSVDLKANQKELVNSIAEEMEDKELENKTVKWLSHYDINPGKGQVKNTALYLFEEKYGGKIEWIVTDYDNRYQNLAKLVVADNAPDMFPANDMDTFPRGAISSMFQPIDDYIDFESDAWSDVKELNDKFIFNGSHYIAAAAIEPSYVCVYNPQTMKNAGMEDPAQLFEDGKWDWDAFGDMCKEFTNPDEDKYGLDGYWYQNAISETSGVPLIGINDGKIVSNLKDPAVSEVQNWMYDLAKNNVMFPRAENQWNTRGNGENGNGLASGLTLFIPIGLWAIEDSVENIKLFGDPQSDEVMFVPMPKKPGTDKYYVSSRIQGFCLCSHAKNPEGYAAYAECAMRCANNEDVRNIGLDNLRDEYKWTDEMIEMRETIYDLAMENPVFDFQKGVSDDVDAQMNDISQATMITDGTSTTWTQCIEEHEIGLDFFINEANTKIKEEPEK